jgi:rhodanese-related sulfurtransferase
MHKLVWACLAVLLVMPPALSSNGRVTDEKKTEPTVNFISAEELKTKVNTNEPVVIIDVRNSESYASNDAKIKGAMHVNVRKLKYRLGFPPLKDVPKDRQVVTYCSCPSDEASIKAAHVLSGSGFTNVRVLKGGWQQWQKASGPVEPRARG